VTVRDGEFVAFDSGIGWTVKADLFGATFHRINDAPPFQPAAPQPGVSIDGSGVVSIAGHTAKLHSLAGSSASAALQRTLAVTLPLSHAIYMVALAAG